MKRARRAVRLALGLAVAGVGCSAEAPPRDQWLIAIETDANVPQFGDRLLVELLDEAGSSLCSGCRRQFGVHRANDWPVSFGLVPGAGLGAGARVRARLYRSEDTGPDGFPVGPMLLDAVGRLPPAGGIVAVRLRLAMRCFGVPSELANARTCDGATGELGAEAVLDDSGEPLSPNAWAPAIPVPYPPEGAPEGMIGIPGGVFLLGSVQDVLGVGAPTALPERVVQLAPFALDADEFTVGTARKLVEGGKLPPPRMTADADDACTYPGARADADASKDAYPLNCVSAIEAAAMCQAVGKRLPTEVEWEYAAGNTTTETTYPWGDEGDACALSVLGRGRDAFETLLPEPSLLCRKDPLLADGVLLPWGPVPGGSPADVTRLGVRNLGGNVSEWVDGAAVSYADPCWRSLGGDVPEVDLVDPVCRVRGALASARGGSWAVPPIAARVYGRNGAPPGSAQPTIGFRCALSP